MKIENKHPIKYFAIGLEKFSHYDYGTNELEPVHEIYAYIVAKCYLISETKIHNEDGSKTMRYGVVPMWDFKSDQSIVPLYTFNKECANQKITKNIFDDIESARNYTRELNKEMYDEKLSCCKLEKIEQYKKELDYELEQAYKIEEKYLNKQLVKKRKR